MATTRVSPAAAMTTVLTLGCGPLVWHPASTWTANYDLCYPPNWVNYWNTHSYYSPAICPSSWTVGCTRSYSDQGPSVTAGETAMMCVPRYVSANAVPFHCSFAG